MLKISIPSWFYRLIGARRFETVCASAFNYFRQLNEEIFACLTEAAYQDNIYLFERRIHLAKENILRSLVLLSIIKKAPHEDRITSKLNRLYDAMMAYAQLRNRISDFEVLGVCIDEMKKIEEAINQLFIEARSNFMDHQYINDVHPLSNAIQQLENNYQQVLSVTAKEPLVFLLFIASLQLFCEEIVSLD